MKNIIFLLVAFTSLSAFAQSVELKINGEQYYCSKDPNGGGSNTTFCDSKIKYVQSKYTMCTKSNGPTYCFSQVSSELNSLKKDCPEVAEVCYNICKNSNGETYCYSQCYN